MCGNLRNASTQEMQVFITGNKLNSTNNLPVISKQTSQHTTLVSTKDNQNSSSKPFNPYVRQKMTSIPSASNSKLSLLSMGIENKAQTFPILDNIRQNHHESMISSKITKHNFATVNKQGNISHFPSSTFTPKKNAKIIPQIHSDTRIATPITTPRYCNMYQPGPIPIDREAAKEWIFPVHPDYSLRDYQLEISHTAVQNNTLVSLPTGLGKTFIAAVVLYNYYRWFPHGGKVIFLAPTLPLVDQQVKACYDIMGIPAQDTAVLNGKVPAVARESLWKERRVFFCTPQTVGKDMEANRCPTSHVVCLVFDEAHKAVGNYPYTKIVEFCEAAGARCRILGLSATPGARVKQVQNVIDALRITRLETRTEDEVKDFIHERHNEIVVVKSRSIYHDIERKFNAIIEPLMTKLRTNTNISDKIGANVATLTSYCIHKARQHHHSTTSDHRFDGYFIAAQKLIDARANLFSHGIGSVRGRLIELQNTPQRGLLATVVKSSEFQDLVESVISASSGKQNSKETAEDKRGNNPKLEKLEEILREHFHRATASGCTTRAIVFSQWRDSVSEIVDVLRLSEPLIRPRYFVGQSSGSANKVSSTKGMPQKVQQEVIRDFQEGIFNVLVCTCIGEEGLDIGEVDLIVNYDTLRSPIRMIQRVGRTGRKRSGRVVCLVSEGQEQRDLIQSKNSEKSLQRALKRSDNFKLRPNLFVLPQEPKLVKQVMLVTDQLRLSQLGGNSATVRHKKKISSDEVTVDWKLSPHLESIRYLTFGKISSINCLSTSIPVYLKRKLLRARLRSHSAGQAITLNRGSKVAILKKIEQGSSITCDFKVIKKQRAMERDCIGLFPLEKHDNVLPDLTISVDWENVMPLAPIVSTSIKQVNNTSLLSSKEDVNISIPEVMMIDYNMSTSRNIADNRNIDKKETEIISLRLPTPPPSSSEDEADENDNHNCFKVPTLTNHSGIRLPTPPASSSSESEDGKEDNIQEKKLVTASNTESFECSSINIVNSTIVANNQLLLREEEKSLNFRVDTPPSSPGHRLLLPTQESSSDEDSNKFDVEMNSDILFQPDKDRLSLKTMSYKSPENSSIFEQRLSSDSKQVSSITDNVNNMKDDSCYIHDTAFVKASTLIHAPSLFLSDISPIKKDFHGKGLTTVSSAYGSREIVLDESLDLENHEIITKRTRKRKNVIMTPQSDNNESSRTYFLDSNTDLSRDFDSSCQSLQACQNKLGSKFDGMPSQLVDTPPREKAISKYPQQDDVNDIVCAVCQCGDSSHADPIVLCDGALDVACDFAVHVSCYSLQKSVIDALVEWRCDICEFKHVLKSQDFDLRCLMCHKGGGLKRLDSSPNTLQWVHPYCMAWSDESAEHICEYCLLPGARKCGIYACNRSAHPHCVRNLVDDEYWLVVVETDKKQSSIFCNIHRSQEHCKIAFCASDTDRSPRCFILPSSRLTMVVSSKRDEPSTLDDFNCHDVAKKARPNQDVKTFAKRERIKQNIENRRQLSVKRSKFIDDEAEIDSDEDIEGDDEELADIRRIDEEEELAALDFINDSSQLGTYTQDALDRIEDNTEEEFTHEGFDRHRQLDFEHDRNLQFATPILNRRMVRKNLDTEDIEGCWSDPQFSGASRSSSQGLGNCHFIRSVLDHARQGGDVQDIEMLYKEIEDELGSDESNSLEREESQPSMVVSTPIILDYVPSDEDEDCK
jgi:ERCC4-related helicase